MPFENPEGKFGVFHSNPTTDPFIYTAYTEG
jgi:hypothetical protein